VVHRQLIRTCLRRRLLASTGLALAALVAIPSAQAANRRVAISDYRWSVPQIQIDLGEHVTWYWTGPDTMHSVTGDSSSSAGMDSDPNVSVPRHQIGDSFQLTFNTPGNYSFQCKLHPTVRGTVDVSSVPGDPSAELDPIPRSNVDLTPPYVDGLRLRSRHFSKRGTVLRFGIDERASVDAEIYRLVARHGGGHRRSFAGWQAWHAHVGFNDLAFAVDGRHFHPRPGSYIAVLRFTDAANNTARARRLRFSIHA
jgi:plastocyanin